MSVPTIDLSNDTDATAQQQMQAALNQVSPEAATEINQIMEKYHTLSNVVKHYGHFDRTQAQNMLGSDDLDVIYRDLFDINTDTPQTNEFLRLEELYSAITGSTPETTSPFDMKGLFTNIDESTMAAMYEIMYNAPMNYQDYYNYLADGDPKYYEGQVDNRITNDNADGSKSAHFNRIRPFVNGFEQVVVDNTYTDDDYREDMGIMPNEEHVVLNPLASNEAPSYGYAEISQVLQLGLQSTMPVEAAVYFTSLQTRANRNLVLPNYGRKDLRQVHHRCNFQLSQCAAAVLSNVIKGMTIVYNRMSSNSIITILASTNLQIAHPVIYLLCKKTLLECYALCYSIRHPNKYFKYLTYRDLVGIRVNLRWLKNWFDQYGEYRSIAEVWLDLDEAVGYMIPQLSNMIGTTDIRYVRSLPNHKITDTRRRKK